MRHDYVELLPKAFLRYLEQPPPNSALARAIAHGVDPTLTFRNMYGMSRRERLAQANATIMQAQTIERVRASRAVR